MTCFTYCYFVLSEICKPWCLIISNHSLTTWAWTRHFDSSVIPCKHVKISVDFYITQMSTQQMTSTTMPCSKSHTSLFSMFWSLFWTKCIALWLADYIYICLPSSDLNQNYLTITLHSTICINSTHSALATGSDHQALFHIVCIAWSAFPKWQETTSSE